MIRLVAVCLLLVLCACAYETGPPGGNSIGSNVNPITGERNSGSR